MSRPYHPSPSLLRPGCIPFLSPWPRHIKIPLTSAFHALSPQRSSVSLCSPQEAVGRRGLLEGTELFLVRLIEPHCRNQYTRFCPRLGRLCCVLCKYPTIKALGCCRHPASVGRPLPASAVWGSPARRLHPCSPETRAGLSAVVRVVHWGLPREPPERGQPSRERWDHP